MYFHDNGIIEAVPENDILYMESRVKMLNVYTVKEQFKIPRRTCGRILDELGNENLIKCSRQTLVNINHIKSIDRVNRYIIIDGISEAVEIGASMIKQFFEELKKRGRLL